MTDEELAAFLVELLGAPDVAPVASQDRVHTMATVMPHIASFLETKDNGSLARTCTAFRTADPIRYLRDIVVDSSENARVLERVRAPDSLTIDVDNIYDMDWMTWVSFYLTRILPGIRSLEWSGFVPEALLAGAGNVETLSITFDDQEVLEAWLGVIAKYSRADARYVGANGAEYMPLLRRLCIVSTEDDDDETYEISLTDLARVEDLEVHGERVVVVGQLPRTTVSFVTHVASTRDTYSLWWSGGAYSRLETLCLGVDVESSLGIFALPFVAGGGLPVLRKLNCRVAGCDYDALIRAVATGCPELCALGLFIDNAEDETTVEVEAEAPIPPMPNLILFQTYVDADAPREDVAAHIKKLVASDAVPALQVLRTQVASRDVVAFAELLGQKTPGLRELASWMDEPIENKIVISVDMQRAILAALPGLKTLDLRWMPHDVLTGYVDAHARLDNLIVSMDAYPQNVPIKRVGIVSVSESTVVNRARWLEERGLDGVYFPISGPYPLDMELDHEEGYTDD